MRDELPDGLPFDRYRSAIAEIATRPGRNWEDDSRALSALVDKASHRSREALEHRAIAEARVSDARAARVAARRRADVAGATVASLCLVALALSVVTIEARRGQPAWGFWALACLSANGAAMEVTRIVARMTDASDDGRPGFFDPYHEGVASYALAYLVFPFKLALVVGAIAISVLVAH